MLLGQEQTDYEFVYSVKAPYHGDDHSHQVPKCLIYQVLLVYIRQIHYQPGTWVFATLEKSLPVTRCLIYRKNHWKPPGDQDSFHHETKNFSPGDQKIFTRRPKNFHQETKNFSLGDQDGGHDSWPIQGRLARWKDAGEMK